MTVAADGTSTKTPTKLVHEFVPFSRAMKHDFGKLKPRQLKKTSAALWSTLTLFATQLGGEEPTATNLVNTSLTFLPTLNVTPALVPATLLERIARTQRFEFPASVAVVGGVAGQDVLNILGGKEEPVRNLMVFEGETSAANVWALGV